MHEPKDRHRLPPGSVSLPCKRSNASPQGRRRQWLPESPFRPEPCAPEPPPRPAGRRTPQLQQPKPAQQDSAERQMSQAPHFKQQKSGSGPRQNTPPNNPPASNSAPPPYPARPAQPPYPQTPPPMPPQNAPGASNTAPTAPAPSGPPRQPETGVWGPPPSAPGTPPPPTPGWGAPNGQPQPQERGRAQAAGERAGKAVASAKGKVNKLRGQFDNFRNGFAKTEADTPEGDGTPPQNR